MHTKGEWYIDKELTDNGAPIIVSDNCWTGRKRQIAKVLYHNGSEDPEVQANARLIAAAPDLLAACKNAILLIIGERIKNDNLKPDSIIEEHLEVLLRMSENELEKAIEKAEGK